MPFKFNPFTGKLDYYGIDADTDPAIGGPITGGTEGSVLFVNPDEIIAQDNANFFWDDTNNRLGLGNNSPGYQLHIVSNDGLQADVQIDAGGGQSSFLNFYSTQGLVSAPTNSLIGDILGTIGFQGYASGRADRAHIKGLVDAAPGGSNLPTALVFYTGNGISTAESMRITSDRFVGIWTAIPDAPLAVPYTITNPTTNPTKAAGISTTATITAGNAVNIEAIAGTIATRISTGVTASGALSALHYTSYRNNAADAGTATLIRSMWLEYGHVTGLDAGAVTTEAHGIHLVSYGQVGTQTTVYGIRHTVGGSGGTNGTSYAIVMNQLTGSTATYGLVLINTAARSGLGVSAPTAVLHLQAGTTVAGSAPLKFDAGTNTTVAVVGQMEFDGTRWYGTNTVPTRNTFAWLSDLTGGYVPLTRILTINGVAQDLSVDRTWTITVTGTTNRITVSGGAGATPTIDISAVYVGQSSIITLGTITTGVWTGTTIAIANGGTGQTTALAAFNALSPLTTRGDLLTRDATNNVRVAIGANNTWLKSDGTDPSWSALPGSFSGFANPTSPGVNLTGSVGVATTAMRSDAVLVLDQAIAPTWSSVHLWTATANEFRKNAIGTTYTDSTLLANNTAATAGVFTQYSPSLKFLGHAWDSSLGGSDKTLTFRETLEAQSAGGAGGVFGKFTWRFDNTGGGYSTVMQIEGTTGLLSVLGGVWPITNDTGSLGAVGTAFSDLALGSGGVIDWNNDVQITHSANTLTWTGASSGYLFDAAITTGLAGSVIGAVNFNGLTSGTALLRSPNVAGTPTIALPIQTGQLSTVYVGSDAGGDDTYVISPTFAPAAYAAGQMVILTATTGNTGAATLDYGAGAATIVKRSGGTTLANGDIPAGGRAIMIHDGTNLVLLNPVAH